MHKLQSIKDKQLDSYFDFETLEKLVNQNSQSANCAGVNLVQLHLANLLVDLDFKNSFYENEFFNSGDLLVSQRKGRTNFTVTTIGHADTVIGPENNQYREKNGRLYGAGIADNKSGQLIAISGINYYLKKSSHPNISFNFVSSPNEELGSPGFQEKLALIGRTSDVCIGFEPSMPDGSIITSRKGNYWVELTVKGESFHSGRAVKGHMNCAMDLCRTLVSLESKLNDIDDITMQIGTINGGNSVNTICESVSVTLDFRFSSFESLELIKNKLEDLDANFKECRVHKRKAKLSLKTLDFCPPMGKNKQGEGLLELYKNISGIPCDIHCGGAADINHLSSKDTICFDGFGAVADFMHLEKEYIEKSSLDHKAKAFGEYLLAIDKEILSQTTQ